MNAPALFQQWASLYASPLNEHFYRQIAAALLEKVEGKPGRILELGAGTGTATALLRSSYPEAWLTVTEPAIDMLRYNRARAFPRTRYLLLPAEKVGTLGEKFDFVFGNVCYHWFPPGTLAVVKSCLAPGGKVAFSIPVSGQERAEGNRLLLQVGREVGTGKRPGRQMKPARLYREFSAYFPYLSMTPFMLEESHPPALLTLLLRIRGSFYFLFGDRAALAETRFFHLASRYERLPFVWNLALVVAGI
ncbi:methyltransferase domain-containing protein [Desulfothermobacter acidiphilus]|uniref:methyltransferase domain-containing protein n=1 Tax=Desulfothermobacter acidiphilus TaxID=1938353 RepID=UPI003F89DB9C